MVGGVQFYVMSSYPYWHVHYTYKHSIFDKGFIMLTALHCRFLKSPFASQTIKSFITSTVGNFVIYIWNFLSV